MAFNLFKKKDESKKAHAPAVEAVHDGAQDQKGTPAPAPIGTGSVIRYMHVSEKSSDGQARGHYTFVIDPRATKPQVATEVERRYRVSVRSVKMIKLPSKSRRIGRHIGSKAGIKKAIVVLKEGQSIATA